MKYFIALLGMAFSLTEGHAQQLNTKQIRQSLDEYRNSVHKDFDDFRHQCIKEFTEIVSNPWKEFEETAPVPLPKENPIPPVIIPDDDEDKYSLQDKPVVIEEVIEPDPIIPQPTPIEPIEESTVEEKKFVNFIFFGTSAKVRFDINNKPSLRGVDERNVAEAIKGLRSEDYDNLIIDCLNLRNNLHLSDWAYLQMLLHLSAKITGGAHNDKYLLLAYLYMQSGYKMRLASDGERLYMLYASEHCIFDHAAYNLDNTLYYGLEVLPSKLFICNASFPHEKSLSLIISSQQQFSLSESDTRKITSKKYPDLNVEVAVNKNLIDFYNSYPTSMIRDDFMTRWAIYANTPMEQSIQSKLYPYLKEKTGKLSQYEAASMILNFVQTGFEYEYDDKVWGQDRAFFSEETLYYPYCDCEDRSILLTRLVRDLLGLKCVLVYYPGHLASAIEFTEEDVKGDFIQLDGHKYIIADGTYINAPIGATMPQMNNSSAKVILLE